MIEIKTTLKMNKKTQSVELKKIMREVLAEVAADAALYAQRILHDQKISDQGILADSIEADFSKLDDLEVRVVAAAIHAPYIEFGTGPGAEEPHPKYMPPYQVIESWCKRKLGISGKELPKVAKAIQWSIYHHGTQPKPFMRPARNWAEHELETRMKGELGEAFKKVEMEEVSVR